MNSRLFGGFGLGLLALSAIEVLIFLTVTLAVFGAERRFSAITRKELRIYLALLPFVVILIAILLTYFR